jgi:hypothetical protein
VVDYRFLTSTTGSNISILITYIVFVTKLQKRQIPEKGFALFENDITTSEPISKYWIHSRNQKCG